MPRARGPGDTLPPILLQYLATGDHHDHGAPPGGRLCSGCWEAFQLHGGWLKWSMSPGAWPHLDGVPAELRALWERHREQIEAATPPDFEPYVVTLLREAERLQRIQRGEAPSGDEDEQHDAP